MQPPKNTETPQPTSDDWQRLANQLEHGEIYPRLAPFITQRPAPQSVGTPAVPVAVSQRPHSQLLAELWQRLRTVRLCKRFVLVAAVATACLYVLAAGWFFVPAKLAFSTASPTCTINPLLLPKLHEHQASGAFLPKPASTWTIGGYPIVSLRTCLEPTNAPAQDTVAHTAISFLHIPFLQKQLAVSVEQLPSATAQFAGDTPVSSKAPLAFTLSDQDIVFGYQLTAGENTASCEKDASKLDCNLTPLALTQGEVHTITLMRTFAAQPTEGVVLTAAVQTLNPVELTNTSIAQDAVIYHAPTELVLTVNKPLQSAETVALTTSDGNTHPTTFQLNGQTITVRFVEPLARKTSYTLGIKQLTAQDGSQLDAPISLSFTASGGPEVTSSSIGASRVPVHANVTLTFTIGLQREQDFSKFAYIEVGGRAVAGVVTVNGNRLTLNPSSNLPACTAFRVVVNAGLANEYGVGNGAAWAMNSRTLCQVASTIGTSVQGRGITSYRFGSGANKIVFVGGLHGNEKSSVVTMGALVDYLENNSNVIPANRSIIIVPNANPDGYAKSTRTNANNVDLNRNFPSNDWQSAVQMPGGQHLPQGGGNAPLDQPESAALANFILREKPQLVLTYHATTRTIISNDVGNSIAVGKQYARDSGYRFSTDADSNSVFSYETTGEFENWLADKPRIPTLLVELSHISKNLLNTHRTAILRVIQM